MFSPQIIQHWSNWRQIVPLYAKAPIETPLPISETLFFILKSRKSASLVNQCSLLNWVITVVSTPKVRPNSRSNCYKERRHATRSSLRWTQRMKRYVRWPLRRLLLSMTSLAMWSTFSYLRTTARNKVHDQKVLQRSASSSRDWSIQTFPNFCCFRPLRIILYLDRVRRC